MMRREFITLLGAAAAAAWPLAAWAQPRIPRLCFLTFDPGTLRTTRFETFFATLRDLGHVDDKPSTSTTLPLTGVANGFPPSPPNACASTRTSSP